MTPTSFRARHSRIAAGLLLISTATGVTAIAAGTAGVTHAPNTSSVQFFGISSCWE
jgi:hypothetical protein